MSTKSSLTPADCQGRVDFAAWEKTFEDQQALQTGAAFRPIPTAQASLIFLEEFK
jgi:hypothetical protein